MIDTVSREADKHQMRIYRANTSAMQQRENMLRGHCKQRIHFAVDICCDWVPTDVNISDKHYSQATYRI